MDISQNLETGLEQTTGLEYVTVTDLRTSPQDELAVQWLYSTPYAENQPVRNREHVRLLIASIDENLRFVNFHMESNPTLFTQAHWWVDEICWVEVNTAEGGWARTILRDVYTEINDISSENFGNAEMLEASEAFSNAEAFMLCSLWMNQQIIPEGYTFGTVEE
jgi:hypothetical protein